MCLANPKASNEGSSNWMLGEDGQLYRVLPPAAHSQVETTFRELSQPRFAAALASFREAMNAYDDRPQRGKRYLSARADLQRYLGDGGTLAHA
jgi:hypothetical protein